MSIGIGYSHSSADSSSKSGYLPMPKSGLEKGLTPEFWQQFLGQKKSDSEKYVNAQSNIKQTEQELYSLQEKLEAAQSEGNAKKAGKIQKKIDKQNRKLESFQNKAETYEPAYESEAEGQRVGIDAASDDILEVLKRQGPEIANAYGAAGDAHGSRANDLLDSIMNGSGLSPVTLENINNLAKGIDFGLGGENFGSFVPKGNASALDSILGNRTDNMGVFADVNQNLFDTANQTTDMKAQAELTPLQAALANAERPTVQQMLSGDLWKMLSPLTELRYITGGPTTNSNSSSSGDSASIGVGGGT